MRQNTIEDEMIVFGVLGLAPSPLTRTDCKIMEYEWKQTLNNG